MVFYFRPKQWVSWDFIKITTGKTIEFIQDTYTIKKPQRQETFAQAMYRHELSDKDLVAIKNRYRSFALLFLTMSLALIFYSIHTLLSYQWMQSLTSLSLSFYVGALAFRYHFWYFQIEKQRLGMGFADWWTFLKERNYSL